MNLLVGVGNPDQRDDGVGPWVVRELHRQRPALAVRELRGDGAGLLSLFEEADDILVVDAVRGQGEPGKIHRLDALKDPPPSRFLRCTGHTFGIAEAVAMAGVLGRLPRRLLIYGVEGEDFAWGQELSPAVAGGAAKLVKELLALEA